MASGAATTIARRLVNTAPVATVAREATAFASAATSDVNDHRLLCKIEVSDEDCFTCH